MSWAKELNSQLESYWTNQFRPRLKGLTETEYFWEPVEGCWNIRLVGAGKYVADFQTPEPDPPPVTTIAWRLSHICAAMLLWDQTIQFDGANCDVAPFECPGTAQSALQSLDRSYARWRTGVESLDDEALARNIGPAPGCLMAFADYSMAALVLHINREVIHHGAEVALLRDLYQASRGGHKL